MPPTLKLSYFNIAGAAEKVRLAFVLGGIEFEDHRVNGPEWGELKPTTPYGQLPLLEVDGKVIAQSEAMMRYAGSLAPAINPSAIALEIDEVLGLVGDFSRAWTPSLYIGMRPTQFGYPEEFKGTPDHEALVKSMRQKFLTEELPKFAKFFTAKLAAKNAFICGSAPTLADCALLPELRKFGAGFIDHVPADSLDAYPELTAYVQRCLAVPQIKDWYAKQDAAKAAAAAAAK